MTKDVVVSSVNPGFCYSELRKEHGRLFSVSHHVYLMENADKLYYRVFERLFCRVEAVGACNYTAAALKHILQARSSQVA